LKQSALLYVLSGFASLAVALALAFHAATLESRDATAPLTCSPTEMDFGEVARGDVRGEFVFANHGVEPIQLLHTQLSCSCQKVEMPRARVNPGNSVKCSFIWDTSGQQGEAKSGFVVAYKLASEDKVRRLYCACKGNVILPYEFQPRELTFDFLEKKAQTGLLRFSSSAHHAFAVTDALCFHPAFSAEVRPANEVAVTFDPSKWQAGDTSFDHFVRVRTNVDPMSVCRVRVRCAPGDAGALKGPRR
jgi:hypothetical protein